MCSFLTLILLVSNTDIATLLGSTVIEEIKSHKNCYCSTKFSYCIKQFMTLKIVQHKKFLREKNLMDSKISPIKVFKERKTCTVFWGTDLLTYSRLFAFLLQCFIPAVLTSGYRSGAELVHCVKRPYPGLVNPLQLQRRAHYFQKNKKIMVLWSPIEEQSDR